MEIDIPDWLTKEFIQNALQNNKDISGGNTINVEKIDVVKPMAKGDNYVCEIFRVTTDYRRSDKNSQLLQISLIVKSPVRGQLYDMLIAMGIIQKEVIVYNEYIPKLNELLGENNKLTPNIFECNVENVLILEDLKCSGFIMANRRQQLDFEHCTLALKTLAKFHAASVKIHTSDPELVERVGKEIFFNDDVQIMNKEYVKMTFLLLAQECKATPELNRYVEKITGYSETGWGLLVDIMKRKENNFNVLNHGDYWINNLLFKYIDGKPTDLKLVDLQLSRYHTPAVDLIYFLNGSVQEDVRTNKYDELLNIYLNELNTYLQKWGLSERLSEAELHKMMNEVEFFGMLVTYSMLCAIIGKPEDTMDVKEVTMEDFQNIETNPMAKLYKNTKYKEILKKRLRESEEKGWY